MMVVSAAYQNRPPAPKGEHGPSRVDFIAKLSQELIVCWLRLFNGAFMHFSNAQDWY